jgi:AraC-like DNA-binding protein
MDALSDVLRTTRLMGGVFLHAELTAPWCVESKVSPENCTPFLGRTTDVIPYHYVLEGRLRVEVEGAAPIDLGADEVVLFPRNDSHLMGSDLRLPPVLGDHVVKPPSDGGLATITLGGGGERTSLVCGFLAGEDFERNPIISTLPPLLHLDVKEGNAADWIRSTFNYAAQEIAAGRAGSETVMTKLSELLFVEAVRRYVESLPEQHTGWLAGLKDPYVARALAMLHARLKENWTVEQLGKEVGLSRSALAERFTQVIGLPPMQYLTQWRLQVAAQELRNSSKSILQVAECVGYESEAAFSRAFKRAHGAPPARWRRRR